MFKYLYTQFINILRKFSIRSRLYLIIIILIIVSSLATLFCYIKAKDSILQKTTSNQLSVLEQTGLNVDAEFSRIVLAISAITTDYDTMRNTQNYDVLSFQEQMQINSGFRDDLNSLSLVNRSYSGGEIWSTTQRMAAVMTQITTGSIESSRFVQQTLDGDSFFTYFGAQPVEWNAKSDNQLKYLMIGAKITSSSFTSSAGCALFAFSESQFYNSLFSKSSPSYNTYIVSADGTIVSCADKALLATQQDSHITQWISAEAENGTQLSSGIIDTDAGAMVTAYYDLSVSDWYLVQTCLYDDLLSETSSYFVEFYIVIILCAILLVLIMTPIARSITSPIMVLNNAMQQQKIDLHLQLPVTGNDEITSLTKAFNQQKRHIKSLVNETARVAEEKRVAQYQALQSQINPHFLYNTLDAVNWMAYLSNNMDICQIMNSLSKFFRLSLNSGGDFYKVSSEINHVQSYIDIQNYRFQNRITFINEIDPACTELYTLKLLLQPLVENSFQHGFASGSKSGTIWIRAYTDSNVLYYEVEDDGIGFDNQTNTGFPPKATGGYGLKNIDARIKLYFGAEYGLSVSPRFPHGVLAKITIPRLTEIPKKEETTL